MNNHYPVEVSKINNRFVKHFKEHLYNRSDFHSLCNDIENEYKEVTWVDDKDNDDYATVVFSIGDETTYTTYIWKIDKSNDEISLTHATYVETDIDESDLLDDDDDDNYNINFTDKELLAILALSYQACPEPAYSITNKIIKYFDVEVDTTAEQLGVRVINKIRVDTTDEDNALVEVESHLEFDEPSYE